MCYRYHMTRKVVIEYYLTLVMSAIKALMPDFIAVLVCMMAVLLVFPALFAFL